MAMDRNLVQRILFAAVAIPLALGVVWYGSWPLAVVIALVGWLGAGEFYQLAVHRGARPLRRSGSALAALTPLLFQWQITTMASLGDLAVAAVICLALLVLLVLTLVLLRRGPDDHPLGAAGITLTGIFYTGWLPSFLLLIRASEPEQSWTGTWLVFFPLVVTWVCDTAAMFGGRALGRHKLAPTISPGKTREGALAGVLGGVGVAALFAYWVFPQLEGEGVTRLLEPVTIMALGLVLSIVGQVGDLVESLFKREAGVKDSSHLIPGHGGVLDRFDSLYFVVPVAAVAYLLAGFL